MDVAELGAFLRSRRDRIRPAEVGLPVGPRRRVPGLRRDEVAQLAGASVEYYIELERGAGSQPSEQMLAALARALRLSRDERDYLYHLAGRPVPVDGGSAAHVHPGLLDLLHRMDAAPAQVVTDLHVTLVQNRIAEVLLGRPLQGRRGSAVFRWFTDASVRELYPQADHEAQSWSYTADLRAAVARRGSRDREAQQLVEDLVKVSPEFAGLWAQREVAVFRDERKIMRHPSVGEMEVNCLNLFSEDGRQRLIWCTPVPGTETASKMEFLSVLGQQDLLAREN